MRVRTLVLLVASAVLLVWPLAGPAAAHVGVSAPGATQGGTSQLAFRVPTEKRVPTVRVEIAMPTNTPVAEVIAAPKAGWTISTTTTAPAEPVMTASGQPVTEIVNRVVWTATDGGIGPDGAGEFIVTAGPLPRVPRIVFKVLQTYRGGEVVSWIEEQVPGAPEPEYPAPVLSLAPAPAPATPTALAAGSAPAAPPATTAVATEAPLPAPTTTVAATTGTHDNAAAIGVAAVIALAALLGVAYAAVRSRRSRGRRTQGVRTDR